MGSTGQDTVRKPLQGTGEEGPSEGWKHLSVVLGVETLVVGGRSCGEAGALLVMGQIGSSSWDGATLSRGRRRDRAFRVGLRYLSLPPGGSCKQCPRQAAVAGSVQAASEGIKWSLTPGSTSLGLDLRQNSDQGAQEPTYGWPRQGLPQSPLRPRGVVRLDHTHPACLSWL